MDELEPPEIASEPLITLPFGFTTLICVLGVEKLMGATTVAFTVIVLLVTPLDAFIP